jgi:hypothetical protein
MPASTPKGAEGVEGLPGWAQRQATGESGDGADGATVVERAWQLVRDGEARKAELHDEFDDPDQGGEG